MWDATLEQLLQSPLLKLHLLPDEDGRGQRIDTLVQPPASAHRYEKERTQGANGEPGYLLPVGYVHPHDQAEAPLIGVQCASTILGHDVESTTLNLRRMQQRIQQFRVRNIAIGRKAAPVRMQIDLAFFFGLFVTDQWKRPALAGVDNIPLERLQQQHRTAIRPFIETAVRQELEHFAAIAAAKTKQGKAPLVATGAAAAASSSCSSQLQLPAVHCRCARCDSDIFFYQYRAATTPADNAEANAAAAKNVCGQCAVESPHSMRSLHSYSTRFHAPHGLARLWAATLARAHWLLQD